MSAPSTAIWHFACQRADGTTVEMSIRPPEFGDVTSRERLQSSARTDGGQRYVQDLGRTVVRFEATWRNLSRCERADIERFFGEAGTLWRARPFSITVENDPETAFGISTGMGLSSGQGYSAGDYVVADGGGWGRVYLEQDRIAFSLDGRDTRYGTSLSFSVETDGAALT